MAITPVLHKNLSQSAKENLRVYLHKLRDSCTEKLPPEVELAKMLSVSRGTIRRALDDLEKEGLLLRIHGRGTFLNPNGFQVKANLGAMLEFGTVIQRSGYKSRMELLSVEECPAEEDTAGKLQIPEGSPLTRVVRMYYADSRPAIYSLAFIPRAVFEEQPTEEDWRMRTNFDLLQSEAGRLMVRDCIEICAVTREAAEEELDCRLAQMPDALLRLEACSYDQENVPAIWGAAFYRTDLVRFHLFREREST